MALPEHVQGIRLVHLEDLKSQNLDPVQPHLTTDCPRKWHWEQTSVRRAVGAAARWRRRTLSQRASHPRTRRAPRSSRTAARWPSISRSPPAQAWPARAPTARFAGVAIRSSRVASRRAASIRIHAGMWIVVMERVSATATRRFATVSLGGWGSLVMPAPRGT